jgi:20S proteasome alpha/beta subunit
VRSSASAAVNVSQDDGKLRIHQPDIWHPEKPKRKLRYPSEDLHETAPMTIAAGFKCSDGLVLCADREMTYGNALKVSEGKIQHLVSEAGTTLGITGAGHWTYIRMAAQKIGQLWKKIGVPDLNSATCAMACLRFAHPSARSI